LIRSLGLAAVLLLCGAGQALADPCKAIPDSGPMPTFLYKGQSFSGPVVQVLDGDSLCVAVGKGPQNWVEVRLSDFYAPESHEPGGPGAKAALSRIALGKVASCVSKNRTYDRIAARCTIGGRTLGALLTAEGVAQGGRAYPGKAAPASISSRQAYTSCAAARAAGAAPLRKGQAGYNPKLDGDGDGVACEAK
jgi:endonuclease YncB( thermonuclease family)